MPPDISSTQTQVSVSRTSMLSDEVLVCAAQAGDSSAWVELCERYSQRLLRRLHRMTRNWHDAEDALQEALLSAFRHLNGFQNRSAFSSWLTAIAINSGLMVLRKNRRMPVSFDEMVEYLPSVEVQRTTHRGASPQSLCEQHEAQLRLRRAIGHLSPALRIVTELHVLHDRSIGEIARDLEISNSAVKSRLMRARQCLRASMLRTSQSRIPAATGAEIGNSPLLRRDSSEPGRVGAGVGWSCFPVSRAEKAAVHPGPGEIVEGRNECDC